MEGRAAERAGPRAVVNARAVCTSGGAPARARADGISQVVAYGMVLAVLTGRQGDKDGDGLVSVHEAQRAIREQSPVMAAAFAPGEVAGLANCGRERVG